MEQWKKSFALIWSGQFVSILSSSVVGYAVIFWMSLETGSAEVLATAAIAGMLPQSLLGPLVGVYIDRWDRKRTMIAADTFIALCTLALALLFLFDAARTVHIYLLLACRSAGAAFHTPAMQASVPLLAPETQLTRIAGINQMIRSVSDIASPRSGRCSSASRRSATSCCSTWRAPPSPARHCSSCAFPGPDARRDARVCGANSAKVSAPCTPCRAWAASSHWRSPSGSSSCRSGCCSRS